MSRPRNNGGFTLIELALAALVVSIGLLVLFALARSGTQYARMSETETRAALFADDVFAGMTSISEAISRHSNSNEFEEFWTAFDAGETNITVAAAPMWLEHTPGEPLAITGGTETNRVIFESGGTPLPAIGTNIYDHAIRYFVRVTLTNRTACTPWPDSAMIQLDVNAERTGAGEWHTFITLFSDHGGLQ